MKYRYCLIFSREIFYVTNVLSLNILAVNEITARQTRTQGGYILYNLLARTSFCKHDVIKVCSIKYLTSKIELVLPVFLLLDRSQN